MISRFVALICPHNKSQRKEKPGYILYKNNKIVRIIKFIVLTYN